MASRFTRTDDPGSEAGRERATTVTREPTERSDVDREGRPDAPSASAPRDRLKDARGRQKAEFGGFDKSAIIFGWLVAVGIGAILTGLLSAAGAVIGLSSVSSAEAESSASTIGIVGGVLLVLVLLVAYYCGGYVAGRMARFDGARNGLGVWIVGLVVTLVLAVAAAILGAEYNVLSNLNLPSIPVDGQSLTTGGIIVTLAIIAGSILAAVAGGKAGDRYHKKVDRVAFDAA